MLSNQSQVHETNATDQVSERSRTAESATKDDVTIVLPVLNEEESVGAVIDDLHQNGFRKILVVDGYSTDKTVQVAEGKEVHVVKQQGRGKTGAVSTAIDQVSTPYLLVMDGDYTYDAGDIGKFLDHAKNYDQIIGSRKSGNIRRLHRLGNRSISMLFNTLFGTSLSDVCTGMYLMKLKSAKQMVFHSTGFSVEVEVLAQMSLHGKVTEVPINYRKRIGKPKLSTWMHGVDILNSILGLARIYNPVFLFSLLAASAAIPGSEILLWTIWVWLVDRRIFHSGWALAGMMLLLLASQAFIVGTIAVLLKRTEIRLERLVRESAET